MAALVNPSSSSSTSSNGRGLYESQTPPPLHTPHTHLRSGRGHESNETGSEASSPPPTTSSHSHRDFDTTEVSNEAGYMTTAAAAAAAAAAANSPSASTSTVTDETAQFEADKRAIYK